MSHNNMFQFGHSTQDVYEGFLNDQKRDSRSIRALGFTWGALLAAGIWDAWGWGQGFLWGAAVIGATELKYFIDQSNRNFMLHRIEWERARKWEQGGQ